MFIQGREVFIPYPTFGGVSIYQLIPKKMWVVSMDQKIYVLQDKRGGQHPHAADYVCSTLNECRSLCKRLHPY